MARKNRTIKFSLTKEKPSRLYIRSHTRVSVSMRVRVWDLSNLPHLCVKSRSFPFSNPIVNILSVHTYVNLRPIEGSQLQLIGLSVTFSSTMVTFFVSFIYDVWSYGVQPMTFVLLTTYKRHAFISHATSVKTFY